MSEDTHPTAEQPIPARDRADANGPPGPSATEPALTLPDNDRAHLPTIEELLARIRRLEEQYAALQDTKQLEERVTQRITTRLRRKTMTDMRVPEVPMPQLPAAPTDPPPPEPMPSPSMPGAPPALGEKLPTPPAPEPALPALALPENPAPVARPVPVDVAASAIAPLATVYPVAALPAPVAVAAVPTAEPAKPLGLGRFRWLWRSWFALDILNELRVTLRMLVDPRYHLTWPARVVPIAVLLLIVLSDTEKLAFLFPWNLAPVVGYYVNKLFQIALTFIMFKVLQREVDRYRDLIPDAPRPLRP